MKIRPIATNSRYGSPDLWVRNQPDGGLLHQDPIQGITNTVYVRLRNRGNTTLSTGTVEVIDQLTFPMTGTITVLLPSGLFDRWISYGAHWGEGITVDSSLREIEITAPISATIGAIPMLADEDVIMQLRFEGPAGLEFNMALHERIDGLTTGGIAYQWIIPDTTPPLVAGHTPTSNALDVSLDAPLVVEFNEPVGPLTFEHAITSGQDPGGWQVTWNASYTQATLTHLPFVEDQPMTISILASDANGNAMPNAYAWSFQTWKEEYTILLPLFLR